nr:monothiol bacilliredoxin BrxC family protein [Paenibacillus ihbetae]
MTTIKQLRAALDSTDRRPLLLFKHSTGCPIVCVNLREAESSLSLASRRAAWL